MRNKLSRKFLIVIAMLLISTLMTLVPPIIGFYFGTKFVILTGGEYVTICSLLAGSYIAGNAYIAKAHSPKQQDYEPEH